MIELHTAGTGNGRRPVIMLEECGVPAELKIAAPARRG